MEISSLPGKSFYKSGPSMIMIKKRREKKMNNEDDNGVSFFKILLRDDVDYLPLPPKFAKKYLKKQKNQTLVVKPKSSLKWKVKYLEIEDRYYFMNGWLNFMKENDVKMGDFLIFWRLSPSIFQVYIYAPNGCLKNPITTTSSGGVGGKNEKMLKKSLVKEEETSDDEDDSMETDKKSLKRVITKTCIYKLPIAKGFLKDAGIYGCYKLRLKNEDGKVWEVKVKKYGSKNNTFMTTGWIDFKKDNKIQIGDLCEFTHVKANVLLVHIVKKGKQVVKNR